MAYSPPQSVPSVKFRLNFYAPCRWHFLMLNEVFGGPPRQSLGRSVQTKQDRLHWECPMTRIAAKLSSPYESSCHIRSPTNQKAINDLETVSSDTNPQGTSGTSGIRTPTSGPKVTSTSRCANSELLAYTSKLGVNLFCSFC